MVDAKEAAKALASKMDPREFAKQFRDFLIKSNMLALALAVVLGNATTLVVNSFVKEIFGKFFDVIVPRAGWDALTWSPWRFQFRIGIVISVLIEFLIVAGVVFFITKLFVKQATPPPTKICDACEELIHPDAKRCKFCTSEQPAPPPAEAPKPAA